MKPFFLGLGLLVVLFAGCSSANRLERIQTSPPSNSDIVGRYFILEETASSRSLQDSELKNCQVDIAADGTVKFVDFPLFNSPRGFRGIFTKITESGRWLISSEPVGYFVDFFRENGDRFRAAVTEEGNPSDLILYYGPRAEGYFTKLRKL